MRKKIHNISIRKAIILITTAFMVISIGSTGYIVFSRWYNSAKQTTEAIAKEVSEHLYSEFNNYLSVPEQINELNHKIISGGILKLENEIERDKFFVGVLTSYQSEINSFSYGTVNGEYFGARYNDQGEIEIIRTDASTNWQTWFYTVNDDTTASEVVQKNGEYDPRTRAWYIAAIQANKPTFSPIYKHFNMDDLTISYACPVHDENGNIQGVIATHLLLDDIGNHLKGSVDIYNGFALIVEKQSQQLVANSFGYANYTISDEGTWIRNNLSSINNPDILNAFQKYVNNAISNYFYQGKQYNLYTNVKEIEKSGLTWVVITAIPDDFLMTHFSETIHFAFLVVVLSLVFFFVIYSLGTSYILKPMKKLLITADAFSSGDLTKRVVIIRDDEIGKISASFNKVADNMQDLINNLEATVEERTEALYRTNLALEENQNRLELILNSAAEAIFGVDLNGRFTFCNISCLNLLGYTNQNELLGKNMHDYIHHTSPDGESIDISECKLSQAYLKGIKTQSSDEVFWRKDGTSFNVAYFAYPQIKDGNIIGAVITFLDITERKLREAEIEYLSYHDSLTGLINRRRFEEYCHKFDVPEYLPISVIFGDLNGLKMTNDVFGHSAGDELIKKSASILQESCRQTDVIARVGGDEFVIILPKTDRKQAEKVIERIDSGFSGARIEAIKCSISLGLDTKKHINENLDQVIANAENAMYRKKTMNRINNNNEILDTIIETLHRRNPKEKRHSYNVSKLCAQMGKALHFSEPEINKLSRVGFIHDIGKIVLDEKIVSSDYLNDEEKEQMRLHPVVGYRILNIFDDTLDLAEYVYGHHERWDGQGYPRGLKGEEIPLISRIIAIAETYERVYTRTDYPISDRKSIAINTINEGIGTIFDPKIATTFIQMVKHFNQLDTE